MQRVPGPIVAAHLAVAASIFAFIGVASAKPNSDMCHQAFWCNNFSTATGLLVVVVVVRQLPSACSSVFVTARSTVVISVPSVWVMTTRPSG